MKNNPVDFIPPGWLRTDINVLKSNVSQLLVEFAEFKRRFNSANNNDALQSYVIFEGTVVMPKLPLDSEDAFNDLNVKCLSDEMFMTELVKIWLWVCVKIWILIQISSHLQANRLQQIVPLQKKMNVRVKRVFEHLVTYDVIKTYNWTGKVTNISSFVKKNVFQDLGGLVALFKKTIATSPADMLVIEKSMADFLRRSFQYQKMKGIREDFQLH
jgi:hypothetical protein